MNKFIVDDVFVVKKIDPDGKKFDKVSRVQADSEASHMQLLLDVNTEVYSVQTGMRFAMVLTKNIAFDESGAAIEAELAWRVPSLADKYEYVMYGRVFKFEDVSSGNVRIFWGVVDEARGGASTV